MTAVIILLNVIFATAVVAGMVALHGWAIVTEHRAHHGTNPLRGILRVRPKVRVPSLRWARELSTTAR